MGKFGIIETENKSNLAYSPTDKILSKLTSNNQSKSHGYLLSSSSPNKLEILHTLRIVSDVSENPFYPSLQDIWTGMESKANDSTSNFKNSLPLHPIHPLNALHDTDVQVIDSIEFKGLKELKSINESMMKSTEECIQEFKQLKLDREKKELEKETSIKLQQEKERETKELKEKEVKIREAKEKELQESNHQKQLQKQFELEKFEKEKQLQSQQSPVMQVKQSQEKEKESSISTQACQVASEYLNKIWEIKKSIKPKMKSNPSMNQQIFKGKMTITTRIGQFNHLQSKVIEIAQSIDQLLSQYTNQTEIQSYLMYLIAKQLVLQAEKEIAVKTDMAFPIAVFCVLLIRKHAPFEGILFGKMIQKCPYIIPLYESHQIQGLDKDKFSLIEFYSKEQNQIQYTERMCGILALYSAIIQTSNVPNPYSIDHGWSWLARILNLEPRSISPLLLYTFLTIAGHEMYKKYPNQMPKLVGALVQDYVPKIPSDAIASTTRLNSFLQECNGMIPLHSGAKLKR